LSWASGSNATKFGIGAKFDLDKEASVRAKVNNASQIGLGYQQKLRDGEFVMFSSLNELLNENFFNSRHHFVAVNLNRWQEFQCWWPQDRCCS
jgi:voltage-dependent anion channel protein 2